MRTIKISVVIPVYNCALYLRECLQSILGQTLTETEIIVIDDMSTDETAAIVEEFVKIDNRIQFYHNQMKLGAALTRNRGMTYAAGKYLYFFDGDDILERNVFLESYEKLEQYKADFIQLNYNCITEYGELYDRKSNICISHDNESINNFDDIANQPLKWLQFSNATWSKIYRRDFLMENVLVYQNLPSSDDTYFNIMALFLAEKFIHLNSEKAVVYYRRYMSNNRISIGRNPIDGYLVFVKTKQKLIELGLWEKAVSYIITTLFRVMRVDYTECENIIWKNSYRDFMQEVGLRTIISSEDAEYGSLDTVIQEECMNVWNGMDDFTYLPELSMKIQVNHWLLSNDKIAKIIRNNEKRVSVWGCGAYGKTLIEILLYNKVEIHHLFDKNVNLYERGNTKIEISDFNKVGETIELLIVSTNKYFTEIYETVTAVNKECEVIDLINTVF